MDAHDLVSEVRREPMYLDEKGSVNPKYEELHDLAKGVLDRTATDLKTPGATDPSNHAQEPRSNFKR